MFYRWNVLVSVDSAPDIVEKFGCLEMEFGIIGFNHLRENDTLSSFAFSGVAPGVNVETMTYNLEWRIEGALKKCGIQKGYQIINATKWGGGD